jgi:DNA polymerase-3 subunit delta
MIANFILLTGPDDFRRSARQRFLLDSFRAKYPEGEVTRFEDQNTFSDLQNTVLTPNLFASRRLVITDSFWNPDHFESAEKANFWEALLGQQDSVTLIANEPALDKRTKAAKALLKTGKVESYDLLEAPELMGWMIRTAEQKGGLLNQSEAQFMLNRCGVDGWNLNSEISKLAMASNGQPITRELIEQLTLPHPSAVVWDFLAALSKKQARPALKSFKLLLASGESAHMIMAMIIREVRIHAQLKAGNDDNLDAKAIASRTKLHPFVVQKTLPLSKKFTQGQIKTMYEQLLTLDRRLKTGGLSVSTDDAGELELSIERFIITSCDSL